MNTEKQLNSDWTQRNSWTSTKHNETIKQRTAIEHTETVKQQLKNKNSWTVDSKKTTGHTVFEQLHSVNTNKVEQWLNTEKQLNSDWTYTLEKFEQLLNS